MIERENFATLENFSQQDFAINAFSNHWAPTEVGFFHWFNDISVYVFANAFSYSSLMQMSVLLSLAL